jgi:hypothetical protein
MGSLFPVPSSVPGSSGRGQHRLGRPYGRMTELALDACWPGSRAAATSARLELELTSVRHPRAPQAATPGGSWDSGWPRGESAEDQPAPGGPLAHISHQASAATAPWHALSGFRSVGLLNVVSATPARPSVAKANHSAPLNRLATNPGEKCGLGRRRAKWLPALRGLPRREGEHDIGPAVHDQLDGDEEPDDPEP